jgi:alpha-beta hydrolase superfamily lysophospholipase
VPFLIAGLLYGLLAPPALAVVAMVCLARRRPLGRVVLRGAAGSLIGFALGGVLAALIGVTMPAWPARVGATVLVAPACVGLALLGLALGSATPLLAGRSDA